jgi:hypothetical protein
VIDERMLEDIIKILSVSQTKRNAAKQELKNQAREIEKKKSVLERARKAGIKLMRLIASEKMSRKKALNKLASEVLRLYEEAISDRKGLT